MSTHLHDRAIGRWSNILPELGVAREFLKAKHGPCPICGGVDRFRYDDKAGRGTWFCSHCGSGSGVDLIMKLHGVPFLEAKRMIEPLIGRAAFQAPRAQRGVDPAKHLETWKYANRLTGVDPASIYLRNRGVEFQCAPASLRWVSNARYYREQSSFTEHPAMIALFVSPDRETTIVHRTFITEDGQKADLGCDEKGVPWPAKKLARGSVPKGGAVRLAQSAPTMGIAEGIETALAASILAGIPVWAATTADLLMAWQPPENVRHVLIYGDNDHSYAGQYKAYGLAYRLRAMGINVEVRFPPEQGDDWNDVLMSERGAMTNA
jgi:putative DNA primase/helicase